MDGQTKLTCRRPLSYPVFSQTKSSGLGPCLVPRPISPVTEGVLPFAEDVGGGRRVGAGVVAADREVDVATLGITSTIV